MKGAALSGRTVLGLAGVGLLWGCSVSHRMGPISPCAAPLEDQEISWFGPTDSRDRRANGVRCRTSGPPVVIESPGAFFEALHPGDSLAIFSWNVAVGGGDLLAFLEQEVGIVCLGSETRASTAFPYFALLLQEAFRRSEDLPPLDDPGLAARRSVHAPHPRGDPDVLEVAGLCGLATFYVPSARNGADVPGEGRLDKGNAILSTLPLSDLLAVENPFETERKVSVAASVPTPGFAQLRLVSAHMEVTSTFRRALLTGNQTRARQAAGLIEALRAHEEEQGRSPPTLVGGDFNTWSGGESALKMVRAAFPDSPPWDGLSTMGPFPTDHIFFRKGSTGGDPVEGPSPLVADSYRRIDRRYSSDHHGRFVWLRFGGGQDRR
jgi:endonuclease/exonuclease/phosphatase family metal-dependent hydrolase